MGLIFDIGALDGKYTEGYLKAGFRVVAVEPQPGRAEALRERFAGQKVEVVAAACGRECGRAKLYLTAVPWLATLDPVKWSKGRFSGYRWENCIDVPLVTLDQLIGLYGQPDFIKIDVEGAEAEVLGGLSVPVASLCYEFTREYLKDVETCARRLLELGEYEFAASYGDAHQPGYYGSLSNIIAELNSQSFPALWGDIYARLIHG